MIRNAVIATIGFSIAASAVNAHDAAAQGAPPGPVNVRIQATIIPKIIIADVSEFAPAIPAVDSGGRCEGLRSAVGMTTGQRGYLYVFDTDGTRTRIVHVVIDSLHQLVRYSDARGHLQRTNAEMMSNAPPSGIRTTLNLNAVQGFGMLENVGPGLADVPIQVRAAAFLDAPNLGVPRNMIEHVLRECAVEK